MSPESTELELIPLKETSVLKIRTKESTLLVDTAAELTKGYHWINVLLSEILNERYTEQIEDENGKIHNRTKFHPLTMKLIEERRKTIDQIYKISGGELRNEVKKELGKLSAKMIFEASKNQNTKSTYIEQAKSIIEASFDEDNKS
jgi:hypothetical protein